ncbi:hypothetical protein [Planococcus halotolerans]|uniref:Uncharacterized protein n=1 Tax=Planococcus halotolerans TaxID=2233542 RepID=A0A365L1K1_9BACL|nr:hypothetical protein [Planococcus halotolerans]QHJ70912.1 hypothetical protein DNR44_009955 [Planococcus halotolerans]RAZ79331.1 hypothetical protein DP120_06890 [Planococcus halotolerans]
MDYYAMEPPFEISEFEVMTKKEAQQHFDWFVSQIPDRLSQLKALYAWSSENDALPLDGSPESLIALWEWFIPLVEAEPKSYEQIAKELAQLPEWVQEAYLENPYEFTLSTHSLINDIGIYFGEVFLKEFPELEWGFVTKPKSLVHVNRPIVILKDASFELEPRQLIYTLTLEVLKDETKKETLRELYEFWREYL